MLRYVFRYKFSILLAVLISLGSLLPGDSVPGHSLFSIPHFDKIAHMAMYGAFAFVVLMESSRKTRSGRACLLLLLLLFLISALMELLQATLVPSRGAEWYDLLANLLGLAGGYLAFRIADRFGLFGFLRS